MERPLILFAHGAGVPSSSPWMQGWKSRLSTLGAVVTFDYPYAAAGRRRPDPQAVLLEAHRAAYKAARRDHPGAPIFLAGKSLGCRISCHLALEVPTAAVVCFGYRLVGANGKLRDEVLRQLRVPILFIQGTRDHICPLDALEQVRAEMTAPSALLSAEGQVKPLIDRVLPLSGAETAFAKSRGGHVRGKLVLSIGGSEPAA